jgi:hypothetical protein
VSSIPGIEPLRVSSRVREVFESALSLLELLRCDLRCSLESNFSSLRDDSFLDEESRRRSGLESLTFDGIIVESACGDLTRGMYLA